MVFCPPVQSGALLRMAGKPFPQHSTRWSSAAQAKKSTADVGVVVGALCGPWINSFPMSRPAQDTSPVVRSAQVW